MTITNRIDDAQLLKVSEAAQLLRISRNLAYELVAKGELPSVRLGRLIRVPRSSLEAWIARQTGRPDTLSKAVSFPLPQQRH
jgi:excisionase family DNA binding protein